MSPTMKQPVNMSLRSVLVHLDGTARAETRLRLAHQLASAHGAALTALFAVTPRYLPLLPLAGGVPTMPIPADIDPDHRAHAKDLFARAQDAGAPASHWEELSGEPVVATFARRALLADLLVLGQRHPSDAARFDVPADFVESVLLDSGRPALVVPYLGEATAEPRTVLVAWKPTREAARAVTGAQPFLRSAKRVHAVCADAHGSDEDEALARLDQYLRLHGVEALREHHSLPGSDAGNGLLSLAADVDAELLVMGCYGHSRARELVLGGATRTVLESMTLPVLMAH